MSGCTAPSRGHRTSSGAANCPVCKYKYGYGYSSRSSTYPSTNSYSPGGSSNRTSSYSRVSSRSSKPRWSPRSSSVYYTPEEIRTLNPIRENFEKRESKPDFRDIFLCHAWDDRKGPAKELHDLLESKSVSVWFSEKDVLLGTSLLREIDKGLAKSRVGLVLVTPAFLNRIQNDGIADKELSALLARDLLVPIVHNTTFEELRDVSPLLGSRSGLNTKEESMNAVADKIAELVTPSSIAYS